jgi:hypothetical protein
MSFIFTALLLPWIKPEMVEVRGMKYAGVRAFMLGLGNTSWWKELHLWRPAPPLPDFMDSNELSSHSYLPFPHL